MRFRVWLIVLAVLGVFLMTCTHLRTRNSPEYLAEQPGAADPGESGYQQATRLFYEKNYAEALRAYQEIIEQVPQTRYLPEARFKVAECLFLTGDYQNAAVHYHRYIEANPLGSFVPDAKARREQCLAKGATAYETLISEEASSDRLTAVMVPVLAGRDFSEIEREVDRLVKAGFNTIILRVFQLEGQPYHGTVVESGAQEGVYFRTERAPVVQDLLPDVAKICRERGARIFAWMNTRTADFGFASQRDLKTWKFDTDKRKAVPTDGLGLFHAEVEEYLTGLVRDLALCDIDGILLHDDLYLGESEGLSPDARYRFQETYHENLIPSRLFPMAGVVQDEPPGQFWNWVRMKTERIVELQAALARAAKEVRPTIRVGVSLHCNSYLDFESAQVLFGQDPFKIGDEGFDYYAVDLYQSEVARDLSLTKSQARDFIEEIFVKAKAIAGRPERVIVKLQLVDWRREQLVEHEEVRELIERLLGDTPPSVALFPYQPSYPFEQLTKTISKLGASIPERANTEDTDEAIQD